LLEINIFPVNIVPPAITDCDEKYSWFSHYSRIETTTDFAKI